MFTHIAVYVCELSPSSYFMHFILVTVTAALTDPNTINIKCELTLNFA